jgi:hypothetical protein
MNNSFKLVKLYDQHHSKWLLIWKARCICSNHLSYPAIGILDIL